MATYRSTPGEPRWHRLVRGLCFVMFIVVWLEAAGCFVYFMILAREGSPVAMGDLAAGIVNHGHVFYVAASQKKFYELLLTVMLIGIPSTMLTGFLLHHLVGVKIFRNR
jgi:hypothetical protein